MQPNLPLIDTLDMPKGAVFWADDGLYEVIEVERKGFRRARGWRKDETTDVALEPNSPLAQRYPVKRQGYLLPSFASRNALLKSGQLACFVFPVEQLALDAAHLDTALCGTSSGLYVRRHARHPAFEVTNGAFIGRQYYFTRTNQGLNTNLADLKNRLQVTLIKHSDGEDHWRLLDSWEESPYDVMQTQAIRPVELEDTIPNLNLGDTLVNLKSLKDILPPDDDG